MGEPKRWDDLARVVKQRREAMRLPQNLSDRSHGPGEITVRKIERGDGATVQPRTWARLEAALSWREGAVDRVLRGEATEEDLDPNHRVARGTATLRVGASGSSLVDAVDRVGESWSGLQEIGVHAARATGSAPRPTVVTDSGSVTDTASVVEVPAPEGVRACYQALGELSGLTHPSAAAERARAALVGFLAEVEQHHGQADD